MKSGNVALIGRPNVGKSTLLNNLLGQKVTITSPHPQTTRFPVRAVYEDERGQIIFIDTPGIFGKAADALTKKVNPQAEKVLQQGVNLIVYMIDHTRSRDLEENKTLGLARMFDTPKLLVVNKTDMVKPDYWAEYAFYQDEFTDSIRISALKRTNLNRLLEKIFALLPEGKALVDTKNLVQPGLNLDAKLFVSEIIREKTFLNTRDEVPYTVAAQVDEISRRENGVVYIRGRIITTADRYKAMIIGQKGKTVKEIGMAVRKELEQATMKKIYIDLTVEVNPYWQETY